MADADRTLDYDLQSMRQHIEKRRANIAVFEQAIADENAGIADDERIITALEAKQERERVAREKFTEDQLDAAVQHAERVARLRGG